MDYFIVDTIDERNVNIKNSLQDYVAYEYGQTIDPPSGRANYVFSPKSSITSDSIQAQSRVFYFIAPEKTLIELRSKNCELICFMQDEIFLHMNSYYTAESSLAYLIENTSLALSEQKILILGGGNLGRALCKLYKAMSLDTTLFATTPAEEDFAYSQAINCVNFDSIYNSLEKFDIIVNTVPCLLFDSNVPLKKTCLILELASKTHAFDYQNLKDIRYIIATGIPSKYCPTSASKLALDIIMRRIFKEKNYGFKK